MFNNKRWMTPLICLLCVEIFAFSHGTSADWSRSFLRTGWIEWRYQPSAVWQSSQSVPQSLPWMYLKFQDHWSWQGSEWVTWRWTGVMSFDKLEQSGQVAFQQARVSGDLFFKLLPGLYTGLGLSARQDKVWTSPDNQSVPWSRQVLPSLVTRYVW